MKRQLNKQEKEMSEKNLKILKEEYADLSEEIDMIGHHEIILQFNFKRAKLDFEKKKKQLNIRLKQLTSTLNILEDQINNGVEIKLKSKSKKR